MVYDMSLNDRLRLLSQVAGFAQPQSLSLTSLPFQAVAASPFANLLRSALLQQLAVLPAPPQNMPRLPSSFMYRFGQDGMSTDIARLFPAANSTASQTSLVQDTPQSQPTQQNQATPTDGGVPPLPSDMPTSSTDTSPTDTNQVPNLPGDTTPTTETPVTTSSLQNMSPLPPELGTDPAAYRFTPDDYTTFQDKFAEIVTANGGAAYTPASDWDKLHNYLLFLSGALKDQWTVDGSKTLSADAAALFKTKATDLIDTHNLNVAAADLDAEFPTADGSPSTALKALTTLLYFKANGAPDANWQNMIAPEPTEDKPVTETPVTTTKA